MIGMKLTVSTEFALYIEKQKKIKKLVIHYCLLISRTWSTLKSFGLISERLHGGWKRMNFETLERPKKLSISPQFYLNCKSVCIYE